jgi:hypothetical protein
VRVPLLKMTDTGDGSFCRNSGMTRSLIENSWAITSSMPVESEAAEFMHQKNMAAAASSIFLTCRKREGKDSGGACLPGAAYRRETAADLGPAPDLDRENDR